MAHPSHPTTPPRSSRPTPSLSSPVTPPLPETPHTSLPTPSTVRQPSRRPIPAKNEMSNDMDIERSMALSQGSSSGDEDNDETLLSDVELQDMQRALDETPGADRDKLAGMVSVSRWPCADHSSNHCSPSTPRGCPSCSIKSMLSKRPLPRCSKKHCSTRQ